AHVTYHVVVIRDLYVVIDRDVAGRDDASALLVEHDRRLIHVVQADGDVLEVQEDLDDVLLQTFQRGVLVEHAVDLDFGDGGTRNRGQQDATQRVAKRVTETAL